MQYLVMCRFKDKSKALVTIELDVKRGIIATFGEPEQGTPMDKYVATKVMQDVYCLFPDAREVFLKVVT